MRLRYCVALLAACLMAQTQTLSVSKLMDWLRSPATAKESDSALAAFLSKVKLTDRLDDRTIESLRGQVLFGAKTMDALHKLRDQSKSLPEPAAGGASGASGGIVAPPTPTAEEQAAFIDDARRYALEYSQKLPDFICIEHEQRLATPNRPGRGGGVIAPRMSTGRPRTPSPRRSPTSSRRKWRRCCSTTTPTPPRT